MRVKTFLISVLLLCLAVPAMAQLRTEADSSGRMVTNSRLNFNTDAGRLLLQNPAKVMRFRMGMWRTNVSNQRLVPNRESLLSRNANGQGGVTAVNWSHANQRINNWIFRPVMGQARVTNFQMVRAASLMRSGHRQINSRLQTQNTAALFSRPSQYFRSTPKKNNNPEPSPELAIEAAAKNSLALFVQAKSSDGMFPVLDPMTDSVWSSWLVSNPKLRKAGRDYVAQAGFYGSAPGSSDVYPMVVQFRLEGAGKNWHVRDVKLVTVNNVARPGVAQFLRFVESRDGTVGVEEVKQAI